MCIYIMLKKVAPFAILAGLATNYYYLKTHPIALTNPIITRLLSTIHQYVVVASTQKPEYSIRLFKALLNLQIIDKDPSLSNFILRSGFDIEGQYIE